MISIETTRLILRKPSVADMLILRLLWKDETVRQYLGGVVSDDLIDKKVTTLFEHWNKYEFGLCAVYDKLQQKVVGLCGLYYSTDGNELSYMFFPSSWGKGIAKAATLASLAYGFEVLNFNRIIAITQEANTRSCALLQNIGMINVDQFRRFDANQCLYEKLKRSNESSDS